MAVPYEKRKAAEDFVARAKANPKASKDLLEANRKLRELEKKFGALDSVSNSSMAAKQRLSQAYEKVGDLYSELGVSNLAVSSYKGARNNAPYESVRERIGKKISDIEHPSYEALEKMLKMRAWLYLGIISFASSLLSVTLRLTGNVVGSAYSKSNWISLCLFFVGCLFTLFYFRARRKK
jgi:hypothetical protein